MCFHVTLIFFSKEVERDVEDFTRDDQRHSQCIG